MPEITRSILLLINEGQAGVQYTIFSAAEQLIDSFVIFDDANISDQTGNELQFFIARHDPAEILMYCTHFLLQYE